MSNNVLRRRARILPQPSANSSLQWLHQQDAGGNLLLIAAPSPNGKHIYIYIYISLWGFSNIGCPKIKPPLFSTPPEKCTSHHACLKHPQLQLARRAQHYSSGRTKAHRLDESSPSRGLQKTNETTWQARGYVNQARRPCDSLSLLT